MSLFPQIYLRSTSEQILQKEGLYGVDICLHLRRICLSVALTGIEEAFGTGTGMLREPLFRV